MIRRPNKIRGWRDAAVAAGLATAMIAAEAYPARAEEDAKADSEPSAAQNLEETRLLMDKWIETQQILAKESKDWRESKDILKGRLDLARREIETLKGKMKEADTGAGESDKKKRELLAEKDAVDASIAKLTEAVAVTEKDVRELYKRLPEPLRSKIEPLYQRIPEDPAAAKTSAAERFQNVLGVLNEINKANGEIAVHYEVHTLAGGKPSEVKVLYVGLAQAYYLSARGEGGIGRPGAEGWTWEPSAAIASLILRTLEIQQGKHTPAFVSLPVRIQ